MNLIDSDFFEGRGNLEGFYTSFAYSFTDAIIGTIRYGYANRIDSTARHRRQQPGYSQYQPHQELQSGADGFDLEILTRHLNVT